MTTRTTLTVATALTLGVAAVVGATTAADGAATAAAAKPHSRTLVVVERAVAETSIDLGARGDSRGDQLAFANPVYDAANKVKVGNDLGSCVRTVPGVSYECTWTLRVHGGSLVVTGPFLDGGDSTLAITGGTGRYSAASGAMTLHARDKTGSSYRFTYRIS